MASTEDTQMLPSFPQRFAKRDTHPPKQIGYQLVKYRWWLLSLISEVVNRWFAILAGPMRRTNSLTGYVIKFYILPIFLVIITLIVLGTLNVYLFYHLLYHPLRSLIQTNLIRPLQYLYTALADTGASLSVIPVIGPLWCSTIALGCNERWNNTANAANVSNNATISVVTASTVEEVEYANSLIGSIRKLSRYPNTLNRNYIIVSDMGHRIQHRSKLLSRESIGNDLLKVGGKSHKIADSMASLNVDAQRVIFDTIDGYQQLNDALNRSHNDSNALQFVLSSRQRLVEDVGSWLTDLQEKVKNDKEQTDDAMKLANSIKGDVMRAQDKKSEEWYLYLASPSSWLGVIPWVETRSKIERKNLQADLELTETALSQLGELHSDLADVSTMLSGFRSMVIAARTTNNRNRYTGLSQDELLFNLKRRLESSREQIAGW